MESTLITTPQALQLQHSIEIKSGKMDKRKEIIIGTDMIMLFNCNIKYKPMERVKPW
jgi:hypothetical protein